MAAEPVRPEIAELSGVEVESVETGIDCPDPQVSVRIFGQGVYRVARQSRTVALAVAGEATLLFRKGAEPLAVCAGPYQTVAALVEYRYVVL